MIRRFLAFAFVLLLSPAVLAAASSFQLLSPRYTSVAGGESQVFSVRFLTSTGAPAAGEPVSFTNDACGNFQNAMASITVATDAQGVASAAFTASNPPGITCWINARAGAVTAVFNVLTFRLSGAYVVGATVPATPALGKPFTITASAKFGVYAMANVEIAARVVSGTGNATVFPASAVSGSNGTVTFAVTPDASIGDFEVELDYRGHKATVPFMAPPSPLQDMWWAGASENGWGVSVVQHGDMLFAVVYAYDAAGAPTWYVVPGGAWNASHTAFTGAVYAPLGSPFYAYDASRFAVGSSVGSATFTFADANNASLDYTIAGVTGHKALSRQLFGPQDVTAPAGVGDMWWGGAGQNGWGLAVLQQYRTLFMVWFTYDAAGVPTWYVMPAGAWTDASTYEGRIYRASGSPWLGRAYDASAFRATDVGSFRLRLAGSSAATLEYAIEGRTGMLDLVRQPF